MGTMAPAGVQLPRKRLGGRNCRPALASSVCLRGACIHRGPHPVSLRRRVRKSGRNQSVSERSPVPDGLGGGDRAVSISRAGGVPDNFSPLIEVRKPNLWFIFYLGFWAKSGVPFSLHLTLSERR